MLYSILRLVLAIALCLSAAGIGVLFTATGQGTWYRTLDQPPWAPPDWVFGPVWTTLYILMGIALWLVWEHAQWQRGKTAITLFLIQLVLNVAWSAIFFAAQSPGWAFVEIVVLWLAIAATIVAFWPISRTAAVLLTPYILWVSFAAALNFAIWRLNA